MRFDLLRPRLALDNSRQTMTGKTTDRLCSLKDAASQFACSPRTVKRLIAKGAIRSVRVGRNLKISQSEIRRVAKDGAG